MSASLPLSPPTGALLADIGGTNARFALAAADASHPDVIDSSIRIYPVKDFPSLADAARHYLEEMHASPDSAVLAVAGPVKDARAHITNHPWTICAERMGAVLGLADVALVNDFTAQAMAVSVLEPAQTLAMGGAPWLGWQDEGDRTYAIIGAGTGLGVGGLLRREGRFHPLQTEGGHASFAPGTDEEIDVLRFLTRQHARVSNERLLSGSGLVNIHRALAHVHGHPALALEPRDITARAQQGDVLCLRAIDMFCAVFGAVAGDLVLTLGAWDGVFLTGGLVPRLAPWLEASPFRQRFEHKGRLSEQMRQVPAMAITHPQPGLLGAAAMSTGRCAQP
ncbi:glucokinase [Marilutibacter spongiae]|uniref:Glucokinase n=1 Tax=Marilutibacter spongiae TaxID=2025720 RepID=A0A7W3TPG9_9GAMM|nr:glucokinase [Lysobacter spongiae]MBB1062092.1 glucokinase [Lysobacter spongiae]